MLSSHSKKCGILPLMGYPNIDNLMSVKTHRNSLESLKDLYDPRKNQFAPKE